ncbi:MAG: sigma 54-interacting transcriptional regulator [Proteobacteria bacterium]|nr:sigma 54-interacting transcriptional regulator [Pseudomonadota bacterium]
MQQSVTPIDYLKEISSWVSSVQDIDQLLELIMDTASRMMFAKASSLMLVDPEAKKLFFKVATGTKKEEIKKYEINIGQGIAGYVAKTGEPLLIEDVNKDPRWHKEISDSLKIETHSMACAPMKVEDTVIGVVQTIDKKDGSPFSEDDLKILIVFAEVAANAIRDARKIAEVNRENRDLKEELGGKYQIVGNSKSIQYVLSDAKKVANSSSSTLILGESGTGKELLARMIHRLSVRKDKPLIVLNCGALTESLLEDELFGHERGAYTGAVGKKVGKFELADGGTLFLDEIGEMSLGMQSKLLRVLQEGSYYRVGGNTMVHVDVRILAATNQDILKQIEDGKFREDLYYRLNVVQIHMPALRERKEDIPFLAEYFLDMFKKERGELDLKLSKAAMDKIIRYDWPGNIRELRNAIERAVVMGDGKEILPEDLPMADSKLSYPGLEVGITLNEALNKFKKEFIILNLKETNGNRSKASKIMGIQRTYLSRLISKFELRDADDDSIDDMDDIDDINTDE